MSSEGLLDPSTPYAGIQRQLRGLEAAVAMEREASSMSEEDYGESIGRERQFNQNCALWAKMEEVVVRVKWIEEDVVGRLEMLERKVNGLQRVPPPPQVPDTPEISSQEGTSSGTGTGTGTGTSSNTVLLEKARKVLQETAAPPREGASLLEECRALACDLKSQLPSRTPAFTQRAKDDLLQVQRLANAAKLSQTPASRAQSYALAQDLVARVRTMLQADEPDTPSDRTHTPSPSRGIT
eukprot:TRINITY_DN27366_c0_g1_i1.p1 TRINITY_DN27366_c0_g1~~TRINITY_DN27366_c0_g1_i1.p1  ORF type:complete len:239 (+),score=45.11 TRINITY_DN27366_c0_g1_i1:74-790(+)